MLRDPFTIDAGTPLILPSILSADFSKLGHEIDDVLIRGGADFLHLDVMDGHFVPNISFGSAIIAGARNATPCYFDAHLMISEPVRYAESFLKAGAQSLTFHVEAVSDAKATARAIRALGCKVGISIKPGTPAEAIFAVLDEVDVVLVMSVEPGFSGQKFMPIALDKCRAIKPKLTKHQRLEIDGGINRQTIASARAAGVDWFVVASAIFGAADRSAEIAALRAALKF